MTHALPPSVRRLTLCGALLAAVVLAALPHATPAHAAPQTPPAPDASPAIPAPPAVPAPPSLPTPPAAPAPDASSTESRAATREIADAIREAAREARREIAREARGAAVPPPADEEADVADRDPDRTRGDTFDDHVPGLSSFVAGVVFIVFLTPILIIALVIWYKIRRTRMHNETMLKLAEKGVVPPAAALQTLAGGRPDTTLARAASALPPAEQVQVLAKRAAWSDLRKGVVMGAVGLALSLHAIIDDGRPGWIGLVLLFVGAGYVALWYFEERQTAQAIDVLRTPATTSERNPE